MDETARTDTGEARGDEPSAGTLLRAAREREGMHIATLAAAIKVAPRKLEALEQDRWDELPGPTFTRALAQAVCRALKTDPQPVMERLPAADTSMLDSTFGTINEPFAGPGGREPGLRGFIPRGPWLVAALFLLLAAAFVIWLPAGSFGKLVAGGSERTSAEGAAGGATPASVSTVPVPQAAGPAAVPATDSSLPAANPAVPQALPASTGAPDPALPAGDLIVQCGARSWIEVVDASGRVLLSRNLEAGESVGLDGQAPLQVVVGNAAGTRLSYKGKPVDVESRARDNVARFELR